MSSYTTLIAAKTTNGSIAQWVNHASAQAAAPTIVEEAESLIYRRLRHWRMTKETSAQTMTVAQDYIATPSDYLQDKVLQILGAVSGSVYNSFVRRKTEEEVKAAYCLDGAGARVQQMPFIFYSLGNDGTPRLKFDSPPDLAYPYTLSYYAQPTALSTSITNFLTTFYPRLLRCACMVGAAEFMKDIGQGNYDRTYWEKETMEEIANAQAESDLQGRSFGGGAIIE